MPETIERVAHVDCTGCGACLNKCPKNAISMKLSGDFPYPVIDHSLCIDCGLCERACPVLHPSYENDESPDCYAYWADDDIRAKSSSGGAFTALAENIIDRGGVVAGAAYSDDCYSVEYRLAESVEALAPLRGSKYVQADTRLVYRDVKRALDAGKPALFVGCPCEVAGMRSFLGRDYPNLYLVDLVCHGVPPQSLYEKFIREEEDKHGSKAVRVSFREKAFSGWNHGTCLDFADGSQYRKKRSECPYLKAFIDRIDLRESCGNCKFAALPRQGDLTLADFWDVRLYDESLDDNKGTGLVLCNNAKGNELLDMLRDSAKLLKPAPLDHAIKHNSQIKYSSIHNEKRDRFRELMNRYGYSFEKAAVYALEDRYDVGLVGWWYGANYGSALTAYALNRTVEGMGKTVLMLNWPMNPPSDEDEPSCGRRFGEHFYDVAEYVPLERMSEFNRRCDAFLVGSDQLWSWYSNRDTGSYYFFLDWADKWHKKIAYSTSFGHDIAYYPEEMRFKLCYLMSRFDYVSVREKSGIQICHHDFGVDAEQTMDPVFLCDMDDWNKALALSNLDANQPYVLGYIMNPTPDKRDAVRRAANELGLPYRILVDGQGDFEELRDELDDDNLLESLPVEDWLFLFRNASYVVTDSFHGFCFSLIFGRQFSIFINPLRGKARIDTLAGLAGVEDRIFETYESFSAARNWECKIDYKTVSKKLSAEVERSRQWLASALQGPRLQPSAAETSFNKFFELEGRINELAQKSENLERELEIERWGEPGTFKRKRRRLFDIIRRGGCALRERGLAYSLGRLREKLARRLHG